MAWMGGLQRKESKPKKSYKGPWHISQKKHITDPQTLKYTVDWRDKSGN